MHKERALVAVRNLLGRDQRILLFVIVGSIVHATTGKDPTALRWMITRLI